MVSVIFVLGIANMDWDVVGSSRVIMVSELLGQTLLEWASKYLYSVSSVLTIS